MRSLPLPWSSIAALALTVLLSPQRADACSPLPAGTVLAVLSERVPADGALLVSQYCYTNCPEEMTLPQTLQVTTAAGELVAGSVVDTDGTSWMAWKPSTPLTVDEIYSVQLSEDDGFGSPVVQAVTALAPMGSTEFDIVPEQMLYETEKGIGEQICCTEGITDTCGSKSCFYPEWALGVAMWVDYYGNDDPRRFQYAYQVTWSDSSGELEQSPWTPANGGSFRFEFPRQAAEYCYTTHVRHLVDGVVTELNSVCVPHGDLWNFETIANSQLKTDALRGCIVPPPGYEQDWCDAFASYEGPCDFDRCIQAQADCDAEPTVTSGTAGSSSGTTAGTTTTSPTTSGSNGNPAQRPVTTSESGCTVTPLTPRRTSSAFAALLAVAAMAAARRRILR